MRSFIDTLPLFPILNQELILFLRRLSPYDWQKQTVARQWKVKDAASHLLDGNLRKISLNRDGWAPPADMEIRSSEDLVQYLNTLNGDWVKATRRLSPALITELLAATNGTVLELFSQLDPWAQSTYAVSWAGETESFNWFDIAREYTERWLHQQQMRDAVNDDGLINRELYYPFLTILMQAWPVAGAATEAQEGTVLKTVITGNGGGEWFLEKQRDNWVLSTQPHQDISAETVIEGGVAWKLFSKSVRKDEIQQHYTITGDRALGEIVLNMVSFMA